MTPKTPDNSADLFRSQLSQMLNISHPLVRLSEQIDWDSLSSEIEVVYSDGVGQPPLPTRLLVGLHYLNTPLPRAMKAWSSVGLRIPIGSTFVVTSICNMSWRYTQRV